MKKLILLFGSLLVLTACNSDDSKQSSNDTTDENVNEESVEVDKGLLNVEVTLPASFFDGQEIDEVIEEAKADGVKEVIQNDDGSLTYKMSKKEHKKILSEMADGIDENIEEIKMGEDFASIQDVKNNKSYSEFTLVVDREQFENSFDGFAAFGLGLTGMFYQVFDGKDADKVNVTISLEDANSGEVFNTVVYPDDLNEEE